MNIFYHSESGALSAKRRRGEKIFGFACLGAASLAVVLLLILLGGIAKDGIAGISMEFLSNNASRRASRSGIAVALQGTLWIIGLTIVMSVPIGVAAAIYLTEFAKKNRVTAFIQLNIANLASVPSIIYALLGLALFVRAMSLGKSVLAGALTMSILILPMIIITAQEALKAVPKTLRESSLALGSTPWQAVTKQVLPAAGPGILTGVILAVSRAIGETAPLITIGAVYLSDAPKKIGDQFTALPVQIFNWAADPREDFRKLAASGILVLLVVLLTMNAFAIVMRNRYSKKS